MTPPNFTPQGADVAYDPMAGTLADSFARAALAFDGKEAPVGNTMAEVVASLDPDPWARDGAQTAPDASPRRANAGSTVAPSVGLNVNILALDLGAKTGFALRRRDATLLHGTEDFTPRASWGPGQKWLRFRSWLSATITEHNITQIAFEDVKRHGPGQVLAAHAYGGFRAMLEMVADQHRVTLIPFGVGQIKKHWTGSGVAKKDEMVMQAKVRGYRAVDDNNADALAILHLAIAREKGEWSAPLAKPKAKRKAGAAAQERKA